MNLDQIHQLQVKARIAYGMLQDMRALDPDHHEPLILIQKLTRELYADARISHIAWGH